jgi:hypothetical protein
MSCFLHRYPPTLRSARSCGPYHYTLDGVSNIKAFFENVKGLDFVQDAHKEGDVEGDIPLQNKWAGTRIKDARRRKIRQRIHIGIAQKNADHLSICLV